MDLRELIPGSLAVARKIQEKIDAFSILQGETPSNMFIWNPELYDSCFKGVDSNAILGGAILNLCSRPGTDSHSGYEFVLASLMVKKNPKDPISRALLGRFLIDKQPVQFGNPNSFSFDFAMEELGRSYKLLDQKDMEGENPAFKFSNYINPYLNKFMTQSLISIMSETKIDIHEIYTRIFLMEIANRLIDDPLIPNQPVGLDKLRHSIPANEIESILSFKKYFEGLI